MLEDDNYRTSTQYRVWSFTPSQLHAQRAETNRIASDKVRAAFARASNSTADAIVPLTPTEEQKILQWFLGKMLELRSSLDPAPTSTVIATAIQYLRRFYLYNSPMTYNPKQIMVSCVWLAYKAEHFPGMNSLSTFCRQLDVTDDEVKAPEFLIMQALRFTIDVRHPMRSLEGGVMDIRQHASHVKCLKALGEGERAKRIGKSGDAARKILTNEMQMTDAYFLYTPAQMWLAALFVVDEELTGDYVRSLFERLGADVAPIREKLMDTVRACAELVQSYKRTEDDATTKKELGRIGKKLRKCQNPEKVDIVAVAREKMAEKREGNDSDFEKKAKKRKLERERLEKDGDVFGGDLKGK